MPDAYLTDGELGFVGLNSRDNPSTLPQGYVSRSVNMRLDQGVATTRKGLKKFSEAELYGPTKSVVGTGVYLNSTGQEILILLVNDTSTTPNVTRLYEFNTNTGVFGSAKPLPVVIASPDGVDIIHAIDKVFISRGHNERVLMWDMQNTFTPLVANDEFPKAAGLMFYQNRIIALGKYNDAAPANRTRDTLCVSHFLQWNKWASTDVFTVNQGGNDEIVSVVPWTMNEFLVLCRNSTFYLNVGSSRYVSGDSLSNEARLESLSVDVGCAAKRSAVQVGSGVMFLSDNGVYYLQPVQSGQPDGVKLLTLSDPLSAPIDDVIQRINRNFVSDAVAAYWNNRYYLAVALDSEEIVVNDETPPDSDEGETEDLSSYPLKDVVTEEAHLLTQAIVQTPIADASLWTNGNGKFYSEATIIANYPSNDVGKWDIFETRVAYSAEDSFWGVDGGYKIISQVITTAAATKKTTPYQFKGLHYSNYAEEMDVYAVFGSTFENGSLTGGDLVPAAGEEPEYWNVRVYIPKKYIQNRVSIEVGDKIFLKGVVFRGSDNQQRTATGDFEVTKVIKRGFLNLVLGYVVFVKVPNIYANSVSVVPTNEVTFRKIASKNNTVLVYNFILKAWESVDLYPQGVDIQSFVVGKQDRKRRLFIVDSNEGILLSEENANDDIGEAQGSPILNTSPQTGPYFGLTGAYVPFRLTENGYENAPISGELVTRRFTANEGKDKRFSSIETDMLLPEGGIVSTFAVTNNPDTETKVDEFVSESTEDATRRNPIRKISYGLQVKFVTSNLQPSIRSNFIKFTINGKNNANTK